MYTVVENHTSQCIFTTINHFVNLDPPPRYPGITIIEVSSRRDMTEVKELSNEELLADSTHPLSTDWKYEGARLINYTWFRLFHCIRFRAQSNIPERGPMIIAPNHVSFYDPPIIAVGIKHRVRFMAWDALFRVPVLRRILIGYGAYPVKLKSADRSAIAQTLKILRNGEAVIIFPEGVRSESGELLPFEQGPARLAAQTGAAIVPVTILGSYEAWPMGKSLPKLFVPMNIKYHAPVYPADLPADLPIKDRANELNRRVAAPINRRLKAWKKLHEKKRTKKL